MFSREKAPQVSMPAPPNIRDIIDDIECFQKSDPIFELAQSLQKKNGNDPNPTSKELDNSTKAEESRIVETKPSFSERTKKVGKKSQSVKKKSDGTSSKLAVWHKPDKTITVYENLIQFTTVSDKVLDLLSEIDPCLKKLDVDMIEFLGKLNLDLQETKCDGATDNE